MLSDERCSGIGAKAGSINIGEGCLCVVFNEDGCSLDKPDSWNLVATGPKVNRDLRGYESKWYQCTTNEQWAQVSKTSYG